MARKWTRLAPVAVLLMTALASAGESEEAWVQRYDGASSDDDGGEAITTDSDGNIYVAGATVEDLGGGASTFRALLLKYSPDGTLLWEQQFEAKGLSDPAAIGTHVAVTPAGQIIMAGSTNSADDWFVAAYDSAGVELWTREYAADSEWLSRPHDMEIDDAGNIYLTGDIGRFTSELVEVASVVKYSAEGTLMWVNEYFGPEFIGASSDALAIDAEGNVYVAGWVARAGLSSEFAVFKLDATGVLQWVMDDGGTPGASEGDRALDIALDGAGNVVAAGHYSVNPGSGTDTVLHKYDAEGTRLWQSVFDVSPTGSDSARHLVIDSSDGIVILGNASFGFEGGDVLIARFDSDGVLLWSDLTGGELEVDDGASAFAIDGNDDLYALAVFDLPDAKKYATMKYDIEGHLRWLSLYAGPLGGGSTPFDLALAPDGSVIVTGESYGGSATRRDVATVKYVQLPPDPDLDGDGSVGFNDLLILLAAWGDCPAPPTSCPADIDDDGVVGFSDLLIVLAAWSG